MTETTTQPKRRSRFVRDTKNVPKIILQRSDIELIKHVADFRVLSREHLSKLLDRSEHGLKRRLRLLWLNRYIFRTYIPPSPGESGKALYTLDRAAIDPLVDHFQENRNHLRKQIEANERAKGRYYEHTLMITNFRICLTLAMRNRHDLVFLDLSRKDGRATTWRADKDLWDQVRVDGEDMPIAPDGYFGLLNKRKPTGRQKNYFMVEADRGTMSVDRFFTKTKAYYQWWKTLKHTKKLGIKNFRVLTITPKENRSESLRAAVTEVTKKGSNIFWFTSEESYDLNHPEKLLEALWRVARDKDDKYHSLVE